MATLTTCDSCSTPLEPFRLDSEVGSYIIPPFRLTRLTNVSPSPTKENMQAKTIDLCAVCLCEILRLGLRKGN